MNASLKFQRSHQVRQAVCTAFRTLIGLCLYHNTDKRLCSRGPDQDAAVSAQRLLLPAHRLLELPGGHHRLLQPRLVGKLHIHQGLGVAGADGGQLRRLLPAPAQELIWLSPVTWLARLAAWPMGFGLPVSAWACPLLSGLGMAALALELYRRRVDRQEVAL